MGISSSRQDTAVCFVIFNPAESKRIIMNFLYTSNLLTLQNIPWFVMELTFEGRHPEIPNAIHVRSNSFMFHKERMCNIMERKIPKKYTKLVFMDADLIYSDNSWYQKMSEMLNTHDIVQGFDNCHWMDLSYKTVELSRPNAVRMPEGFMIHTYHPGFVWGFRREWFKKYGFFDLCISGSGDTLSVASWLNKVLHHTSKVLPKSMVSAYNEYRKNEKPTIGYLENIDIYHLYHGSREKRQYVDRHKPLDIQHDIRDIITINKDEMYEWKEPNKWNPYYLEYFKSREDDEIY